MGGVRGRCVVCSAGGAAAREAELAGVLQGRLIRGTWLPPSELPLLRCLCFATSAQLPLLGLLCGVPLPKASPLFSLCLCSVSAPRGLLWGSSCGVASTCRVAVPIGARSARPETAQKWRSLRAVHLRALPSVLRAWGLPDLSSDANADDLRCTCNLVVTRNLGRT